MQEKTREAKIFPCLEQLKWALTYGASCGLAWLLVPCTLPPHLRNNLLRNSSCTPFYQMKIVAKAYSAWFPDLHMWPFLNRHRLNMPLFRKAEWVSEKKMGLRKKDKGLWQTLSIYCFVLDLQTSQVLWLSLRIIWWRTARLNSNGLHDTARSISHCFKHLIASWFIYTHMQTCGISEVMVHI